MVEDQPRQLSKAEIYTMARDRGLIDGLSPLAQEILRVRWETPGPQFSLAETGRAVVGRSASTTGKIEQKAFRTLKEQLGI